MKTLPPPHPRAVLFDWDNTLVDSFPVIHDALNTTLRAMGHPEWTLGETLERVRRSLRDSFPEMFGDRWEAARDIFYRRYREIHLIKLTARPGAARLLDALADTGLWLSVVSNKAGEHLRREAAHLGWSPYFARLVGATDAVRDKPAHEPVVLALEGSGIACGREVWFVGDTQIDMECAHNSGCIPILIRDSAPESGEFDRFRPEFHFRDCDQLARVASTLRSPHIDGS